MCSHDVRFSELFLNCFRLGIRISSLTARGQASYGFLKYSKYSHCPRPYIMVPHYSVSKYASLPCANYLPYFLGMLAEYSDCMPKITKQSTELDLGNTLPYHDPVSPVFPWYTP